MSENETVRNFQASEIFTAQYKTIKYFLGRRHHIFKANIHDIAKIRILNRLCSDVVIL